MSLQLSIKKQERFLAKLERHVTLDKIKERKKDTRQKIEWGGLVIKSNMNFYPKSVILGALLDAWAQLENDEDLRRLYHVKGELSFLKKGEK